MLSICIPIYNFNVTKLHISLSKQIASLKEDVEIIYIDDASSKFREVNHNYCSNSIFIQLENNIGRSKIRNLFLEYARYEHLLFLDCDGFITHDTFIENYLKTIKNESFDIICGGRIYPKQRPGRNHLLNWEYGIKKESKPYEERLKNSFQSFMTNNFSVKKSILQTIRFDEKITTYGHEDTLFGFVLKEKNKTINHIDNPVLNGDIETNSVFLKKTEESIKNLIYILNNTEYSNSFTEKVKLLRTASKIKKNNLTFFYNIFFTLSNPLMKFLLTKGVYGSLIIFDLYKLGLVIQLQKETKKNTSQYINGDSKHKII